MLIGTSYRQIWKISAPIMIGSAAQSIVALTDSVYLYYLSEEDFASIGFVSTFYLIISAIGFGFSRGGQILIARRAGEMRTDEVGRTYNMVLYFELALALGLYLFMTYGCYWLFAAIIDSDTIFYKSLEYIGTRRYGIFASFAGVAMIALYMGIARPFFIIVDTFILAGVNIVLDYALIFGHWGFPAMGIAGAGLASSIAEIVALVIFVIYMLLDTYAHRFHVFKFPKIDVNLIKQQISLSVPIVVQALVGLGSSFLFFGLIENLGERELAISNLARIVYLVLSIPIWGFSSGINTIVSNYIGQRKRMAVIPILWKTAYMCLGITMLITLPVVLFPETILYPLLGDTRQLLIQDTQPVFYVMIGIMASFAVSSIFFNGMIGAGATGYSLKIQAFSALGYVILIYGAIHLPANNLPLAWACEIIYWVVVLYYSARYMYSLRWYEVEV